jgi:hypothetical protein
MILGSKVRHVTVPVGRGAFGAISGVGMLTFLQKQVIAFM